MSSLFLELDRRLRRLPDAALFAIGLVIVAGMAAFKLTQGRQIPVVDFFLIPVAATGWLTRSRWYGHAVALVTAALTVPLAMDIQDSPIDQAVAAAAARFILYGIVLTVLNALRGMQTLREAEARTDHTTGAVNLRGFLDTAAIEIQRSRRHTHELSLLYLDLDDFKAINDRFGHEAGNQVLRTVSHTLRHLARPSDTVARIGGDEFVVLAPETGPSGAQALAARIRRQLATVSTDDGRQVTCSVGVVTFRHAPVTVAELLREGDRLMYRAKAAGKDRAESGHVTA